MNYEIHELQMHDALREQGYRPWLDKYPDVWKQPDGTGAWLTEEALYMEWQRALARAGRAEHNHAECWRTLVTMAIGSSIIITILTAIAVLHA